MDINKIKQRADMDMIKQNEISNKKKDVIEKFSKMQEVMKNSYEIWNKKTKNAIDEFITSYKQYFMQNDFKIEFSNPFGQSNQLGDTIVATYGNTATIKLSGINYENEHMYIDNFEDDIHVEFWIGLPKGTPNYFAWKDNIQVSGKIIPYNDNDLLTRFKTFVESFNTMEELNEVEKKVEINIQHFSDSVNRDKDIELVIHKFRDDNEYNDFNAFWESIEN